MRRASAVLVSWALAGCGGAPPAPEPPKPQPETTVEAPASAASAPLPSIPSQPPQAPTASAPAEATPSSPEHPDFAVFAPLTGTAPRGPSGESPAGQGIRASDIRDVLHGARPMLRRCYEAALKRDPTLRGRVRIRFVLMATGKVKSAKLEDPAPPEPKVTDGAFRQCLTNTILRLVFPRFEGSEVTIVFPMTSAPPAPPTPPKPTTGPTEVAPPPDPTPSPLPSATSPPSPAPPKVHPAG
ncbi:MAG: AgmX/PglI C-terminal domain-containing protein [Polyangiaceae bacterium]